MTTEIEITKIGEKFVLPLSAEMLDKLGAANGGQIEATISDDAVVLRPLMPDERKTEFRRLKKEIFEEYAEVFQALAEGAK